MIRRPSKPGSLWSLASVLFFWWSRHVTSRNSLHSLAQATPLISRAKLQVSKYSG
ncbi:uncharacterized protein BKA55DRAFT_557814 [Fusarium redolens]|uniref:Uncharacterized protein n=1 Tax=Fusarium redolens TaxID=48865 RepID=A0A9P9HXJ1_FUSRE|nr:uncharacterized protein BKA55DRAFT_557814 [Fusarium redolens]KAH7265086.1 hypothetical protein BKA55DRAFT_557814 [Fusarium redolens]